MAPGPPYLAPNGVEFIEKCFNLPSGYPCGYADAGGGVLQWSVWRMTGSSPYLFNDTEVYIGPYSGSFTYNETITVCSGGCLIIPGNTYYVAVLANVGWQITAELYTLPVITTTSTTTSTTTMTSTASTTTSVTTTATTESTTTTTSTSTTTTSTTKSTTTSTPTTSTSTTGSMLNYEIHITYLNGNDPFCVRYPAGGCDWSLSLQSAYPGSIVAGGWGNATFPAQLYPNDCYPTSNQISWDITMNTPTNETTLILTIVASGGTTVYQTSTTPTGPAELVGSWRPC